MTDSRLQRIALELDLVADSRPDWPDESRAELRALARQIAAFKPERPTIEGCLTPAQARVLAFVRKFMDEHGQPPTRHEIADALGFAANNTAQDHLKAIARKGVITLIEGQARGIRLNKRTLTQTTTSEHT